MDKFIDKVTSAWVAIATLVFSLASTGIIPVPAELIELFGPEITALLTATLELVVKAVAGVIAFYQVVRNVFAKQEALAGKVKTLSGKDKRSFALNPFKLA